MATRVETRTSLSPTSKNRAEALKQFADSIALQRILLICGIVSSVLYLAMNIVVPMMAHQYSVTSQTVSELSAIGAETRYLWVALAIPYGCLVIAFGFGVWLSAGKQNLLKAVGFLLIFNSFVGFFWPPMSLRGDPPVLADALHIVFTGVVVMTFILEMIFAAAAIGGAFRIYSILSIIVLGVFGALTGLEAPRIMVNLPTPMIGVWERISIGSYILWIAVFATVLLRRESQGRAVAHTR